MECIILCSLNLVSFNSGAFAYITVDNDPEFAGKVLDAWANGHGIELDLIWPCKPVENGYIGSFNGRLHDELLNTKIFFTLAEVKEKLEA